MTDSSSPSAPFRIGMVIFDGMTLLDTIGPADIFARVPGVEVLLIGLTNAAITSDSGIEVTPATTIADAPPLEIVFVGGGAGTTTLMEDPAVLDFLRRRSRDAQWVTSVCTGALVLGAAGLLNGYRAATHWTTRELLPYFGAIPVNSRVVFDRNRVTGGGVTAGIDFALTLIAEIWGAERAQLIQLGSEYDPQPPFESGSPEQAAPELVERFRRASEGLTAARRAAAIRAGATPNADLG